MGDRANICIKEKRGGEIFLYTHHAGVFLPRVLARALKRGEDRWGDESYLTRIIFSDMISPDINGTTGFGISTYLTDNEHPIIYVDYKQQTVSIGSHTWRFEDYVELSNFQFSMVEY